MIPYYWKNKWTIISYCHMVFGVVYLANQIITFALILNGNATTFCGAWNLQGITKNFAEANIDWIFTLRVYFLERTPWIQYTWLFLFTALDAIPRIVSLCLYVTTVQPSGLCTLFDPPTPRVVKTVMNTVYIAIVALYFIYKMYQLIKGLGNNTQQFESLSITSTFFAIMLCVTRTVFYIPYILNSWPSITGILVPIQMCILPPLCFLNIAFGAKLNVRGNSNSKVVGNDTTKNSSMMNETPKKIVSKG
ncbi:hypothetical protein HDV04_001636 [Boothiomyces sp. JEL0838]|nr:hypothetical protein HDV04_001636 [Boothiomyces sp. JEL0838]